MMHSSLFVAGLVLLGYHIATPVVAQGCSGTLRQNATAKDRYELIDNIEYLLLGAGQVQQAEAEQQCKAIDKDAVLATVPNMYVNTKLNVMIRDLYLNGSAKGRGNAAAWLGWKLTGSSNGPYKGPAGPYNATSESGMDIMDDAPWSFNGSDPNAYSSVVTSCTHMGPYSWPGGGLESNESWGSWGDLSCWMTNYPLCMKVLQGCPVSSPSKVAVFKNTTKHGDNKTISSNASIGGSSGSNTPIIVGVVIGIVAVIAVAAFIWYRRSHTKQSAQQQV